MRKLIISMIMAALLMLALVAPAFAIVHPATPIGDAGALTASNGKAGGGAAFGAIDDNTSLPVPFTAPKGGDNAQVPTD